METGYGTGTEIKKAMKELERQIWKSRMKEKTALGLYKQRKVEIARELFFDNTRGSSLLFEARTHARKLYLKILKVKSRTRWQFFTIPDGY